MKRFCIGAFSAGMLAAAAMAQQGPVVTARDDAPVAPTAEDAAADGRDEGRLYLGLGVGGSVLHRHASPAPGSDLRGVSPTVVLRLGYDFADSPWSIEGYGSLGRANLKSGSDSARTLFGLGVEGLYHFDRYARFDPFLAGGLSWNSGSAPVWQDGNRSHLFAQAGLGAFWHLTESLSLRGDVRWHVALTDDFISFTSADVGVVWYPGAGGGADDTVSSLPPLADAPIEPGAVRYDDASEHAEALRDVTPVGADHMRLELRVGFAKDTAVIEPAAYPVLDELLRLARRALEVNPEASIELHGHADRQHGSDHEYNRRLSEARAKSVMNYLAQNGVPAGRMKAFGHSFDQPAEPVDLEHGTPANRRVEIAIQNVTEAEREQIRAGR